MTSDRRSTPHARARLAEFRRRLEEDRRRLIRTVSVTGEELTTLEAHQPGATLEDADTLVTAGTLSALEGREKHQLDEIDAARARLEAGAYGVCELCGGAIAVSRLRALPTARYCTRCQETREAPQPGAGRRSSAGAAQASRRAPARVVSRAAVKDARSTTAAVPPTRERATRVSLRGAVSKGTTVFQTDDGPRAAWPASTSRRKKR